MLTMAAPLAGLFVDRNSPRWPLVMGLELTLHLAAAMMGKPCDRHCSCDVNINDGIGHLPNERQNNLVIGTGGSGCARNSLTLCAHA